MLFSSFGIAVGECISCVMLYHQLPERQTDHRTKQECFRDGCVPWVVTVWVVPVCCCSSLMMTEEVETHSSTVTTQMHTHLIQIEILLASESQSLYPSILKMGVVCVGGKVLVPGPPGGSARHNTGAAHRPSTVSVTV
jgi:hypothetical protein